jgi:hypothetical protein
VRFAYRHLAPGALRLPGGGPPLKGAVGRPEGADQRPVADRPSGRPARPAPPTSAARDTARDTGTQPVARTATRSGWGSDEVGWYDW